MCLKILIQELRSLLETIESNLKICEHFSEIIQQMNVILLKLKNLENGQANKIIFIGRQGSRKTEILKNMRKALPSVHVTANNFNKYAIENCGYKKDTDEFQQYESEDGVSNKKEFMDTPYYNYSDELDSEIVNNCWNANTFVVVTNSVGSIGDLDRNFLKEISNKVFMYKLIFIFTGMERVPDNERNGTMIQHKNYAIKIANEILSVQQTNIPIFFTFNDQLDANEFLLKCGTFEISSKAVKMFADNIHSYHEELKGILKEIREQKTEEKSYADKIPQGTQSTEDYLQNILDINLNGRIDDLLKYADPSGDKIDRDNYEFIKESVISNLKKYWPESIDFMNVDLLDNLDGKLYFVFIVFTHYINKQFKSINQISRNIRENIARIFLAVHHFLTVDFSEYNNTDKTQLLIKNCEESIDFDYEFENLLLIDEILGFLIFVEIILIWICIEQRARRKRFYTILYSVSCKEDNFSQNMQLMKDILNQIKIFIKLLKENKNKTIEKLSKSIVVENEKSGLSISFNENLLVMVKRIQNLINKQQVDIFNFDKSGEFDDNFIDLASNRNNAAIN